MRAAHKHTHAKSILWTARRARLGFMATLFFSAALIAGPALGFEPIARAQALVGATHRGHHPPRLGSSATRAASDLTAGPGLAAARTALPSADLELTKLANPDPVGAGNNLTYTIIVKNNGPDPAINVVLSDTIPANTTFQSLQPAAPPLGWTYDTVPVPNGTGTLILKNPSLASGAQVTFTLIVQVNPNTPAKTLIFNTGMLSSDTMDPNVSNNSHTTCNTVLPGGGPPSADLDLTKLANPDPVGAGNNITYTILVKNLGPDTATSVVLNDPLPPNTTFKNVFAPVGWTCLAPAMGGTGTVTCSIPSLSPADPQAIITIIVRVDPTTPNGTLIFNTATISSAVADPVVTNNSKTTCNHVTNSATGPGAGVFGLSNEGSPDPVSAGGMLTYTIKLTNGGSTANNVTMKDTLDSQTTFKSVTAPPGWSCGPPVGQPGVVTCTKPSMTPSEVAIFTLVTMVNCSVPDLTHLNNTAMASSDQNPGLSSTAANTVTNLVAVFPTCQAFASQEKPGALGGNPNHLAGTINIVMPSGCGWTAVVADPNCTWVHIDPGSSSGAGNGIVSYTVDPNNTHLHRSCTITVAGRPFVVYQGALFDDVPITNANYTEIGIFSARSITAGCLLCPNSFPGVGACYCNALDVQRYQTAFFVERSKGDYTPPQAACIFKDVTCDIAANFVEQATKADNQGNRVMGVCPPPLVPDSSPFGPMPMFCPFDPLSREQLAIFVIRALGIFHPPNPVAQRFNDVDPSRPGFAYIDKLAALGITSGCSSNPPFSPPVYCPDSNELRETAAVFFVRAFNLQFCNQVGSAAITVNPNNPVAASNISITLSGTWPNTCAPAQPPTPTVSTIGSEIRIAISNSDSFCVAGTTANQSLRNWTLTVPIGQKPAGTYQVVVNYSSPAVSISPVPITQGTFTVAP